MVARGEVWWVDFGEPFGSEPASRRPAVVVSSDRFNRSRIQTVMVSILTTNLRLTAAPGNVEVPRGLAGLSRESVINVSQTLAIDRMRLVEAAGSLDSMTMQRVNEGLRLVLGL